MSTKPICLTPLFFYSIVLTSWATLSKSIGPKKYLLSKWWTTLPWIAPQKRRHFQERDQTNIPIEFIVVARVDECFCHDNLKRVALSTCALRKKCPFSACHRVFVHFNFCGLLCLIAFDSRYLIMLIVSLSNNHRVKAPSGKTGVIYNSSPINRVHLGTLVNNRRTQVDRGPLFFLDRKPTNAHSSHPSFLLSYRLYILLRPFW